MRLPVRAISGTTSLKSPFVSTVILTAPPASFIDVNPPAVKLVGGEPEPGSKVMVSVVGPEIDPTPVAVAKFF